ncbi:MAG: hypothetical protein ABJ327_12510 [Litoreibacter sp.]
MFFGIVIGSTTSAQAEIRPETPDVQTLDRSIIIDFSYEESLSFLLAEDIILELLKGAKTSIRNSGNTVLRGEISSVSSTSLVFDNPNTDQSCLTAFVTISSGSYQLEFGVLIDVENLKDARPIFILDHLFSCDKTILSSDILRYRLNPINVRIENAPPRFLNINLTTGGANLSGLENEQ